MSERYPFIPWTPEDRFWTRAMSERYPLIPWTPEDTGPGP